MKRPFALLGFAAFAALALSALVGAGGAAVLGKLCALFGCAALILLLLNWKRPFGTRGLRVFLCSLAAAMAVSSVCCLRYASQWASEIAPAQQLDGKTVRITAVTTDTPEHRYHRYYTPLRVEHVMENGKVLPLPQFTLRVSSDTPFACEPFDTVVCTVKCSAFAQGGLYSAANSRYADGYAMGGYVVKGESIYTARGLGLSPAELFVRTRELISEKLSSALPERSFGLVEAMLLGRTDSLNPTDEWNFRKAGAAHLLVISGLHMTIVAAALCFPLRFVRNARVRSLCSCAAVLLFLCVTGFPPAAQRSGLMCMLTFWGAAIGRRTDSLNSLGFAVLVICLFSPFSGGDLGFTLSVLSTLGILCCATRLQGYLTAPLRRHPLCKELSAPVFSSLSVTISALLFTLPIQAAVFGGLSLLSPLVNLLLILPCTAVLYLALPSALLALFPLPAEVTAPLYRLLRLLCELSLQLAEDLSSLHFGYLDLTRAAGLAVLVFLAACVVLAVRAWHSGRVRLLCGMLTVVCALSACTVVPSGQVVSIEVSSDSSCVVMVRGARAAVLSLGGYRTDTAREVLSRRNVSEVELLCFTERTREVREAAAAVAESVPVQTLALEEGRRVPKELKAIPNVIMPADGESITILDGVNVTFSQQMKVLTVCYGWVTAVIETEHGRAKGLSAPLLITARKKLDTISPFTICQNNDIIGTTQTLQSGGERYSMMVLPSRLAHRRCDIIGTTQTLQSGGERYSTMVLPSRPATPQTTQTNPAAGFGQNLLLPGDNGLSVVLHGDGTFSVRGESAWLGTKLT